MRSEEEDGRARRADTELKTKTPHVNVGNNSKSRSSSSRRRKHDKQQGSENAGRSEAVLDCGQERLHEAAPRHRSGCNNFLPLNPV